MNNYGSRIDLVLAANGRGTMCRNANEFVQEFTEAVSLLTKHVCVLLEVHAISLPTLGMSQIALAIKLIVKDVLVQSVQMNN